MTINPGATFADQSITISRLHELVDDATISNLSATQLASGLSGIFPTQPAAPVQGSNYLAAASGRIQTYDGSVWSEEGGEGVDWVYMQNWSGEDTPAGAAVCAHRAQGWPRFNKSDVLIGFAHHVAGIANTTIASGATGKVTIRGNVVMWKSGADVTAGDWVTAPLNGAWAVAPESDPEDSFGGVIKGTNYLGIFLESVSGTFTAWAKIWR